jgi:hypothetical protein
MTVQRKAWGDFSISLSTYRSPSSLQAYGADSLGRTATTDLGHDGEGGVTAEQVAAAIKQRKAQLAPAIQELRSLRQKQQVGGGMRLVL